MAKRVTIRTTHQAAMLQNRQTNACRRSRAITSDLGTRNMAKPQDFPPNFAELSEDADAYVDTGQLRAPDSGVPAGVSVKQSVAQLSIRMR
jgi:hypothetical protein